MRDHRDQQVHRGDQGDRDSLVRKVLRDRKVKQEITVLQVYPDLTAVQDP